MKVAVDRTKCMGLGICEAQAPGVFEIGDDGVLLIQTENATPDQLGAVTAAVKGCPSEALSLIED